ncbi:MAG: hypothetical protein JWR36_486 [Glaciihabitans sp.]|jgi:uncharacterized protein (DUF58 family)|nr:hypothetical protein [Glaciihabitans sp.]MDQ1572014.1 hypothetical protein [Actinomycetota bacterium]
MTGPGTQRSVHTSLAVSRKRATGRRRPVPANSSRPTVRGLAFIGAAVLCGVLGYGLGRSELLYAAGFLILLPLVGLVIVRLRPLRLTVVRTFSPAVVTAGTPTVVELDVRNVSSFASASAAWYDRIPWLPGRAGPGVLPVLPPGGVAATRGARLGYSLRPTLRGVYSIGPLEVEYTDPFGLGVARAEVGSSQSLYVIPAVAPLGDSGPIYVSGDGTARLIQRMATGSDDDLMTREYRTGDALRRVHWRASARHGELMVRQEEQRSFPEARLLIDTRLDGYGGTIAEFGFDDTGFSWFEWGVGMIASLGVHLHRSGFLVQVVETGPRQIAPLGDSNQGSGQDIEFLLSLAGLRLTEPRSLVGNRGTDRAQGVLGPIFAVVADPSRDSLEWIAAQRRPYEAGVAFILQTGSTRAWEQLAAAGWTCVPVVDTDDPAVAWASVSQYIPQSAAERS